MEQDWERTSGLGIEEEEDDSAESVGEDEHDLRESV